MATAVSSSQSGVVSANLGSMGYAVRAPRFKSSVAFGIASTRGCLVVMRQVEWSPFDETKLAVATAQNFGIIGTGKQLVLTTKGGRITEAAAIETKDGVYDCTWRY
jgi:hypothetical protein